MPDYKQSAVAGSSWQRCSSVVIYNRYGGTPSIEFNEEKILSIDGGFINQGVAGCQAEFSATGEFPLLDPETNLPTGQTMTHQALYQALYSLYMQTATARDAA